MKHRYLAPVRFDDVDMYGHVNNVAVVGYFAEARVNFLRSRMSERAVGEASVVVYQEIDYLKPVPFQSEPLTVEVWVTRIGGSSFELAYEMLNDEVLVARASSAIVAYDVSAGRSRKLSPGERAALEAFTESSS